jgi:GDPmannose 4,6-dehydratase
MPRALITGVAGQDGRYLAAYLNRLGYQVVGMLESGTAAERVRVREFAGEIETVVADVTDTVSLIQAISQAAPDEIYNLAGISSVRLAWDLPIRAVEVNGVGVLRLLEATRVAAGARLGDVRVFQASSAQMFGEVEAEWFHEGTPIRPTSPYGAAKALGHFAAASYRDRYGAFVSCGILGNHESPLQDQDFLLRRVTCAASRIAAGEQGMLTLDNLDGVRDWGFAGDYVKAMHAALQHSQPEDFVIATGTTHSVADAVASAFHAAGVADWRPFVRVTGANRGQPHRSARGDIGKARRLLGWSPATSFEELIDLMVRYELDRRGQGGRARGAIAQPGVGGADMAALSADGGRPR